MSKPNPTINTWQMPIINQKYVSHRLKLKLVGFLFADNWCFSAYNSLIPE